MGGALAATIAADDPELAALVLLAPYVDVPPLFRVLVRAAPAIGMVLPYVGGEGARSILDPEARSQALAYGATTPQLVRELVRAADAARASLPAHHGPDTLRAVARGQPDHRGGRQARVRTRGRAHEEARDAGGCGHVLTVDFCRERVAALVSEWLTGEAIANEKGTA